MYDSIQGMHIDKQWPSLQVVAAYVRVSADGEEMMHSLQAQISYYTELINNTAGWVFGGIFIDEAVTGTQVMRPGFQRMLEDCRQGKIHRVITKSISRLARNTVLLHATVRELRELDVDIFFEENNLHSLSHEGDFMLSILASMADEESRIVSENTKWRIRGDFAEGNPNNNTILGYRLVDKGDHKEYAIEPKEALLVKYIFTSFLGGAGCITIARTLHEFGAKTRLGNAWGESTVRKILRNEKYTGLLVLQKTFVSDHISKKKMKNEGQLATYTIPDAHEAIISEAMFTRAQEEMRSRMERFHPGRGKPKEYPFSSLISCMKCGKGYRRKLTGAEPYRKAVWICSTFNKHGRTACGAQQIPEDILEAKTTEVLKLSKFDGQILRNKVEKIQACSHGLLLFFLKNGQIVETYWVNRSRSESWTPEKRQNARNQKLKRSNKDDDS